MLKLDKASETEDNCRFLEMKLAFVDFTVGTYWALPQHAAEAEIMSRQMELFKDGMFTRRPERS